MNKYVDEIKLSDFCIKSLVSNGMSIEHANVMTKVLVTADKWGLYTHGTKNLNGYVEKKVAKGVSFTSIPEIEYSFPSLTVFEGKNTMGYISSTLAMNTACEKAKYAGIAISFVKNSCHNGAIGYYANIAASKGMIGFAASNVDKKMTIPGAKGMVIGHNPFALSAPASIIPSIILDISSSNVASLKVLKAKYAGSLIPDNWISDKNGNVTTDPSKYPDEGALLPFGNHKGYGVAVFIEILTSIILGKEPSTNSQVRSWCFDLNNPNNVCHVFIAINPQLISSYDSFIKNVDNFIRDLHDAPKADGVDRITVPGEKMWERYYSAEKIGIPLPDDVIAELDKLAMKNKVSLDIYKGE